jgi:hypothetical protein
MKYNKAQNESEEDYSAFVEWLENETASRLRQAKGDAVAISAAITTYLETGYKAMLSSGELVDFFCVSDVLDQAGYSEEEAEATIALFDEINPDIFARYHPENLQVKTMKYEAPPPPPPRPGPVPDNPQVSAIQKARGERRAWAALPRRPASLAPVRPRNAHA